MAAISLAWDQDTTFDSFNIYRSDETIDVNALPEPVAVGVKSKSYLDSSISDNASYFYRVGAVRGAELMISDEVHVSSL